MNVVFPIPRISESFFDTVIEKAEGRRLFDEEKTEGIDNADYLMNGAVLELKIFEEEGLEKKTRQEKIKKLFELNYDLPSEVYLDIKIIPDEIKPEYKKILGGPIQTAVKKAAKQIKATKQYLGRSLDLGILLAVNNGYASLQHDEFENLVLTHARKDTSQIDFVICTTLEHHQGDFDSYIFLKTNCYPIKEGLKYPQSDEFIKIINDLFNEMMTIMMRNQMDPKLCDSSLPPVKDIYFDGDDVRYVWRAPEVPDSRFS